MHIHDYLKKNDRNPRDVVTFADLVELTDAGAETATPDPVAEAKAARKAELQKEIDALNAQ